MYIFHFTNPGLLTVTSSAIMATFALNRYLWSLFAKIRDLPAAKTFSFHSSGQLTSLSSSLHQLQEFSNYCPSCWVSSQHSRALPRIYHAQRTRCKIISCIYYCHHGSPLHPSECSGKSCCQVFAKNKEEQREWLQPQAGLCELTILIATLQPFPAHQHLFKTQRAERTKAAFIYSCASFCSTHQPLYQSLICGLLLLHRCLLTSEHYTVSY